MVAMAGEPMAVRVTLEVREGDKVAVILDISGKRKRPLVEETNGTVNGLTIPPYYDDLKFTNEDPPAYGNLSLEDALATAEKWDDAFLDKLRLVLRRL